MEDRTREWIALLQSARPVGSTKPVTRILPRFVRAHGSAGVVAVLLSVCFPDPGGMRPRVFDCNSHETTQFFTRGTIVHFAAEQGDVQLLEVLISAGARLNSREDR